MKELSDKEILIGLISGEGKSEVYGGTSTMSVRLPISEVMKIEALARKAGVTHNKMLSHLLELAILTVEEETGSTPIPKDIMDKHLKGSEIIDELNGEEL